MAAKGKSRGQNGSECKTQALVSIKHPTLYGTSDYSISDERGHDYV